MIKRVYCGKKTKIYIPKIENPKIITCCTNFNKTENGQSTVISIGEISSGKDSRRWKGVDYLCFIFE